MRRTLLSATRTLMAVTGLLVMATVAGQTCNPDMKATAPDSRYVIHGDGTVTDTVTGLMWKRCSEGSSGEDCATGEAALFSWQEALQQAEAVNAAGGFAGYADWRLPNIKELASLVEPSCYEPAINATVFPNTRIDGDDWGLGAYWSASPYAYGTESSWYIFFAYGHDFAYDRSLGFFVRLVRGGR
ncbi:MAG TPA: DUF1566 domain-containing protein [Thiotrichales bacterium]|nr:DUF1566 domain-containing protein [Thiotrichales bacterium]